MPRVALLVLLLSVLSLSEGRTVSRCELRDELGGQVTLPRHLQKIRDRILARVICEVEKFSYLDTNLVREFTKEIIKLDETTTTSPTTTTTTTTTTPTPPTTVPPSPPTTTTTTPAPPPPTTTTTATAPPPLTTTPVTMARRRREAREKRASIRITSVIFYGIFQFSDREYCDSGYHTSENRCSADCFAFSDEDITDDVQCFVESGRFWEVFKWASNNCKSKKTTEVFFDACDAGEETSVSKKRWRTWLSLSANSHK